jgi:hypothetical protein
MRVASAAALAVIVLAASGCKASTSDSSKLVNLRGKGFGGSGLLLPKHPWTVKYGWDCTKQLSEGRNVLQKVRLNVMHADDGSYVEKDYLVQRTGKQGDGVLNYDRPGAYLVTITTDCDYRLRIDQHKETS